MTIRTVWIAVLAAGLLPAAAEACRCAESTLPEYFDRADMVVIGKLQSSSTLDNARTLNFDLLAPAYKGDDGLASGSTVSVTTTTSSASCAVQPVQDAIYVVFASRDGDLYRSDSCNGTRIHLPADGSEPAGFTDVPPRFVAQQLNGLAGLEVMRQVSTSQPKPESLDNDTMIGLLVHGRLAENQPTAIFRQPSDDADPWLTVNDYDAVKTREYDYEVPGAVTFARQPGWYRIRLQDGRFGWIEEDDNTTFLHYPDIVIRRLNYLTEHWSGFIWPEPGAGLPLRDLRAAGEGRREIPAEVHEYRMLAGVPFLRVTVLDVDPCSSGGAGVARFSGWVPAYGQNGRETAWFWSRGC